MSLAIFHTVNAGLYLQSGNTGLLVDGVYAKTVDGFSGMPDGLLGQLLDKTGPFAALSGLLFTHLHDDHYDEERVGRLLAAPGAPMLYGAGLSGRVVPSLPAGDRLHLVQMGDAQVLALDTPHDGTPFQGVPHQSFLIRLGGESVFIAGDASFTPEDALPLKSMSGTPISAVFFNIFQFTRAHMLGFIRALAPRRTFLYHLPCPEDDTYDIRGLAARVLGRLPEDITAEALRQMEWVPGYHKHEQNAEATV